MSSSASSSDATAEPIRLVPNGPLASMHLRVGASWTPQTSAMKAILRSLLSLFPGLVIDVDLVAYLFGFPPELEVLQCRIDPKKVRITQGVRHTGDNLTGHISALGQRLHHGTGADAESLILELEKVHPMYQVIVLGVYSVNGYEINGTALAQTHLVDHSSVPGGVELGAFDLTPPEPASDEADAGELAEVEADADADEAAEEDYGPFYTANFFAGLVRQADGSWWLVNLNHACTPESYGDLDKLAEAMGRQLVPKK